MVTSRPIVLVMSEGSRSFARRKLRDARGSLEAAQALLLHTFDVAETVGDVVVCAPVGSDAASIAVERGHRWIRQASGGIGARIGAALAAVGSESPGSSPVLLLGDDCPGLTEETLSDAAMALEGGAASVVGRARDGGFWLLGLARCDASLAGSLAANIDWCTPRAFLTLRRYLNAIFPGEPALLGELADVDAPEDLAEAVRAAEPVALKRALAAVRPGLAVREPSVDEPWIPYDAAGVDGLPRPPPRL